MQIPSYGAAPLSATFLMVRVMQVISMIVIIGITGNFINDIVMNMQEPPKEIVGALSVASIATLYTLVSIAFYWATANLGLFVMTAVDSLLLIAFIVVAVDFGKPVSYLNCYTIHTTSGDPLKYAFAVESSLKDAVSSSAGAGSMPFSFFNLVTHTTQARCFETKAIWGLSIALCLLFTTSVALLPTLHFKNKK
ncbi:hypothetical protein NA57DRAFT_27015, partial [Rhizodiscina lignyota]